jgi:hypothetical protein
MTAYPSVNWWPTNLRPYESQISFVTRFCELNNISFKQCRDFFGVEFYEDRELAIGDITRISSLLNEMPAVSLSVFAPSISLAACGSYGPSPGRSRSNGIRYCEECAKHGYHSYLHETGWLARCPFHLIELKEADARHRTGSIATRRISTLKEIMRSACRVWPRAEDDSFMLHKQGQFEPLSDWIARATEAAISLSTGEVWRSGNSRNGGASPGQIFGQLRTLGPMPTAIAPLFTEPGSPWHVEVYRFSQQTQIELGHAVSHYPFWSIFDFYKSMGVYSKTPPAFVQRQRQLRDQLKVRHGACRCGWGQVNAGWEIHWLRVHPEEWPCYGYVCPFGVALDELELRWGRWDRVLSWRKAEAERLRILALSSYMHDAGLIRYRRSMRILTGRFLDGSQDIQPWFDWACDSLLTDLLDKTAELEMESGYRALTVWLDGIDRGLKPTVRDDPVDCIRLCKRAKDVLLINWARERTRYA